MYLTRTRKLAAGTITLAGLGAGLLFPAVHPSSYTSTTLIQVAYTSSIADETAIASSRGATELAEKYSHSINLNPIQTSVLTKSIFAISAQASTPIAAQRETSAFAHAYLQYRSRIIRARQTENRKAAIQNTYILSPATGGKAVHSFAAFFTAGWIGLVVGLIIGFLTLFVGGRPRGQIRTATA